MREAAFCGQSLWCSVRFLFCRGGTIMLETITSVNGVVNGIVWGPVGLALLFGTGFVMSVRTGFFQFGHFRY